MRNLLNDRERRAVFTFIFVILLSFLLPSLAQWQSYHQFADQRSWMGIPCAADVLSNLMFFIFGVYGFFIASKAQWPKAFLINSKLFFVAVTLTSLGSAYYHWQANDFGLIWDRLPITITFSLVISNLIYCFISTRGTFLYTAVNIFWGALTVLIWAQFDNLTPYMLWQFGGMLVILLSFWLKPLSNVSWPWKQMLFWYGLAKMTELLDFQIYFLSNAFISGHTLKHIFASISALAVAIYLKKQKISKVGEA